MWCRCTQWCNVLLLILGVIDLVLSKPVLGGGYLGRPTRPSLQEPIRIGKQDTIEIILPSRTSSNSIDFQGRGGSTKNRLENEILDTWNKFFRPSRLECAYTHTKRAYIS